MKDSKQQHIPVALLIIDMINDFQFKEAPLLLPFALSASRRIAQLKEQAKKSSIPVVYVNDNFGRWQSDKQKLIEYCSQNCGKDIVLALQPDEHDYFIIKPKHSGFFSTPLSSLLNELKVNTLILTGIAGNICVLFTANDAYMRDYHLYVPADCVASNIEEDNKRALLLMKNTLKADITHSPSLDLSHIIQQAKTNQAYTMY